MRTPLNGCLASAEMLLETVLCAEQRELANTIKVSGSILLSTVSNFLDFFKVRRRSPTPRAPPPFPAAPRPLSSACTWEQRAAVRRHSS